MLKKLFTVVFLFLALQLSAFCDEIEDVKNFFQSYVSAANAYSPKLIDFYSNNAKIIRVVEKRDGTTSSLVIPMNEYIKQLKSGQKMAKAVRYKNSYTDRVVTKYGDDYKLSATRTPGNDKKGLPAYFIITKNAEGEFKIKEESMNTKVQTFLKYVK